MLRQLFMSRPQQAAIITHLQTCFPQEGCGFLAGTCVEGIGQVSVVYPMVNVLASPTAYAMEPAAMVKTLLEIERLGFTLLAIYHSHPYSAAVPSAQDVTLANYPEAAYLIISLLDGTRPQSKAYLIREQQVQPIPLNIL
ncbi:MAG: M67 family metallopeptidase [Anaerolineae bacterium]|nr:M67 family metallopeptidase [Anaerolineae bacterium]